MHSPSAEGSATVVAALRALPTAPPADRGRLEDVIVSGFLARSRRLAHRYRRKGLDDDDLEQIAATALLLAVRRFHPDRGHFVPFATVTITGELRRAFRDQAWTVRPSRRVQELRLQVLKRREELEQEDQAVASPQRLADDLGADRAEVEEALDVSSCFRPDSLDAPLPGADHGLGDAIGCSDDRFDELDRWLSIVPGLRRLSPRDRATLRLRFVDDLSQTQIGERIGVSQMQISRDIARIIATLRPDVAPA